MSEQVRLVALYEDVPHSRFLRRLTKKLGLREERFVRCGGCSQLLETLVIELREIRPRMKYQKNLGLLVLVDADQGTIDSRIRELESRVAADGLGPRDTTERIAYVVPALEIENWYVHLCVPTARPVNEAADYKPTDVWRNLARDLEWAAKEAIRAWDPASSGEPASLDAARNELKRL